MRARKSSTADRRKRERQQYVLEKAAGVAEQRQSLRDVFAHPPEMTLQQWLDEKVKAWKGNEGETSEAASEDRAGEAGEGERGGVPAPVGTAADTDSEAGE